MTGTPLLRAASVRFPVQPGDVPAEKVARRLHLTASEFGQRLPALLKRGFPAADPDTGMFDLEAVDRWRHLRHRRLFPELTAVAEVDHPVEARPGMGERFIATARRQRNG